MERDFVGYGENPPAILWPRGKRLAVSIVVNYEEGSEREYERNDPRQETEGEWGNSPVPADTRDLATESMYEYGSRVGIWRILRILRRHDVSATIFATATALNRNPQVARALARDSHEICSHGLHWEEVYRLSREDERQHIAEAFQLIEDIMGQPPVGWYCRFGPSVNTRELLVEHGGFLYDSDAYNDDVPYFTTVGSENHLVVPYTADINDLQWWKGNVATTGDFETYLRDSFDLLYDEAKDSIRMMSVGLHCRVIGRPGRTAALDRFLTYIRSFQDVWITTRQGIAEWWYHCDTPEGAR